MVRKTQAFRLMKQAERNYAKAYSMKYGLGRNAGEIRIAKKNLLSAIKLYQEAK